MADGALNGDGAQNQDDREAEAALDDAYGGYVPMAEPADQL